MSGETKVKRRYFIAPFFTGNGKWYIICNVTKGTLIDRYYISSEHDNEIKAKSELRRIQEVRENY